MYIIVYFDCILIYTTLYIIFRCYDVSMYILESPKCSNKMAFELIFIHILYQQFNSWTDVLLCENVIAPHSSGFFIPGHMTHISLFVSLCYPQTHSSTLVCSIEEQHTGLQSWEDQASQW